MPDASPSDFRVWNRGTLQDVWYETTHTDASIPAFFGNRMHLSGPLRPGTKLALFSALAPFSPKRCRTENRPLDRGGEASS